MLRTYQKRRPQRVDDPCLPATAVVATDWRRRCLPRLATRLRPGEPKRALPSPMLGKPAWSDLRESAYRCPKKPALNQARESACKGQFRILRIPDQPQRALQFDRIQLESLVRERRQRVPKFRSVRVRTLCA